MDSKIITNIYLYYKKKFTLRCFNEYKAEKEFEFLNYQFVDFEFCIIFSSHDQINFVTEIS